MAYRDSFLSLYQPTNNSPRVSQDTTTGDLPPQFEEELPATTPVFEGHLYLRTSSKQWEWRLFRFDGTSFICLSSRKVKLPPNTHVDAPLNDLRFLKTSPSLNASFTSPLLATPKNKAQQTSETVSMNNNNNNNNMNNNSNNNDTSPVIASYYQLPKWSVDIVNISAVSVLKPKKKSMKLSVSTQKASKCFCIRTIQGECYIMKAQKQKDLERWLFVLTKMWKFTQAMKSQLLSSQQQQTYNQPIPTVAHPSLPPSQHQQHHPFYSTFPSSSNHLPYHHQQQQQQPMMHVPPPPRHDDSISLSQLYKRPQHRTLTATNSPLIYNTHPQQKNPQPLVVTNGATSPPPPPHFYPSERIDNTLHDKNYVHPILSVEKAECIDAWRQSLSELMASDPHLQVSIPPPIESIPEDDQVSIISDMTSISHRQPNLRRRISVSSSISKRSLKSNKIKPRDNNNNNNSIMLKKKRSDDVKNWIEPRKSDNTTTNTKNSSQENYLINEKVMNNGNNNNNNNNDTTKPRPQVPLIDTYQVTYFQDCITATKSTLSSPFSGNDDNNNNKNNEIEINDHHDDTAIKKSTTVLNQHTKYHGSTAAKQVKIVKRSSSLTSSSPSASPTTSVSPKVTHELPIQTQNLNTAPPVRPTSLFTSSSHDKISEVHLERRSLDKNYHQQQSPPTNALYSPASMLVESPLKTLSQVNRKSKDEDEISLADLQRSLRRASLQNTKNGIPFSTSTTTMGTTTTNTSSGHHHQQHQQPSNSSPMLSIRQSNPITSPTTPVTPSMMMNESFSLSDPSLKHYYNYHHHPSSSQPSSKKNISSMVVAPAIPPVPIVSSKSRNSLLSLPLYENNNNDNSNNKGHSMKMDQHHQYHNQQQQISDQKLYMKKQKDNINTTTVKSNRPHSWMPTLDQQQQHQQDKMMKKQQRQSMQMNNVVHW